MVLGFHRKFQEITVFRNLALALLASLVGEIASSHAEDVIPAVYQRTSSHSMVQQANWSQHGSAWGPGYGGFFNPWFAQPYFAGTWYQRPYPDHLVFNNVRSHAIPMVPLEADCPCLENAE
jgi:hypothetical protein